MVVLGRGGPLQLEEGCVFNRGRQLHPRIAHSAALPMPTMHPDSGTGIGNRNEIKSHMIWAARACTCDYHMICILCIIHTCTMTCSVLGSYVDLITMSSWILDCSVTVDVLHLVHARGS